MLGRFDAVRRAPSRSAESDRSRTPESIVRAPWPAHETESPGVRPVVPGDSGGSPVGGRRGSVKVAREDLRVCRSDRLEAGSRSKLAESHAHALAIAGAEPTGYGLGKAGWVTVPTARAGVTGSARACATRGEAELRASCAEATCSSLSRERWQVGSASRAARAARRGGRRSRRRRSRHRRARSGRGPCDARDRRRCVRGKALTQARPRRSGAVSRASPGRMRCATATASWIGAPFHPYVSR